MNIVVQNGEKTAKLHERNGVVISLRLDVHFLLYM
jgi:hypothetical protein